MEISVPISTLGASAFPSTASLEVPGSGHARFHPRLAHDHGKTVCTFDETKAVLSSLDADSGTFRVLCTLFFREAEDGRRTLSVARPPAELLDTNESLTPTSLSPCVEPHVSITKDALIECVAFWDNTVVVTSSSGAIASVSLRSLSPLPHSSLPTGCLATETALLGGSSVYAWAMDAATGTAVRIRDSGVTMYRIADGCGMAVNEIHFGSAIATVDVAQVSSAVCFVESAHSGSDDKGDSGSCGLLVALLTYRTTGFITVIQLPLVSSTSEAVVLAPHKKVRRVDLTAVQQQPGLTAFPQPDPQIFVRKAPGKGNRFVAVLYPDCVVFGTAVRGAVDLKAVLRSELSLPFLSGSWKAAEVMNCCFLVFRSDAVCLEYEISFDTVPALRILEVALASQIPIPLGAATCMSALEDRILVVRDPEALLRNVDDDVVMLQEPSGTSFRSLESTACPSGSTSTVPPPSVQLLHVPSSDHGHSFLTVLESGECWIASTATRGKRRIAVEEDRRLDVTSCLVFEQNGETVCVMGFRDGDLKVFVGERFSCLVRMAHCGPVDVLLAVPGGGSCDSDAGGDNATATFVSVSTQLGTICFHSGRKAEITKTLTSPSRPLTSCYINRRSEYLLAFSNATGNLWHLPTCRLERAFTSSGIDFPMNGDMSDLLTTQWSPSLSIRPFPFLGHVHYSVNLNIGKMIAYLNATRTVSRDVLCALPLLLQCCNLADVKESSDSGGHAADLTDYAVVNALEDLSLSVSPGRQVFSCVGAIALTCAIAEVAQERLVASQAAALSFRLHEHLVGEIKETAEVNIPHALAVYHTVFFSSVQTVCTSLREGFARMIARLSDELVKRVAAKVITSEMPRETESTQAATDPLDGVAGACPCNGKNSNSFRFLAAIVAVRKAVKGFTNTEIMESLRNAARAKCLRFVRWFHDNGANSHLTAFDSASLLGLAEGYALFADMPEMRELVDCLAWLAFSGACEDARTTCLNALVQITAADPANVVCHVLDACSLSHPSWRPGMIRFLEHFVKAFPCQAASSFTTILDFALRAVSACATPNTLADKRALCVDATMQLVRVAVAHLPNVSLQQNLLQVAVGGPDGKVKVYNLKTAEVITIFQAHAHPILCLSYSSNTVSCDIATVSVMTEHVNIFRAHRQTSSMVSFFSGAPNRFVLETKVDLPTTRASLDDKVAFARYCRVKWLSPQCLQFSSPWHERVQLAL